MLLQTDVAENAHTISAWLKEIETRGFLNYPQLSDQVHNNKEFAKSNCEGTSLMQIIIFTMRACALKRMLLKKECSCFQMGWISWLKIQFEGIFCQMKSRRWKIWMANMKTENLRGNTTLQFTLNGKLSQHGFGHCHENGLIK